MTIPIRKLSLIVTAALFACGWVLLALSETSYKVSFSSVLEVWGDLVRDVDSIGLTLTRVSDEQEMEFGNSIAKEFEPQIVHDQKLQKYVDEIGNSLVKNVQRKGCLRSAFMRQIIEFA